MLKQYGKEINKYPLLTRDEENTLGAKAAAGDADAKERLVKSNLRLVLQIAHSMRGSDRRVCKFEDLVSAGNEGLLVAADRFDPGRGAKFSTYASWWIKHRMMRQIKKQTVVRFPMQEMAAMMKARRIAKEMGTTDPGEVAKRMDIKPGRAKRLLQGYSEVSLNAPVSGEEDAPELMEKTDFGNSTPVFSAEGEMLEDMKRMLEGNDVLDERAKKIITMRYGLDGGGERKLNDIAEVLHCTRERVRQIEMESLRKLKSAFDAIV